MLCPKTILPTFLFLCQLAAQPQEYPRKIIVDKIVAVVNDQPLLYSDIRNTVASAELPPSNECAATEQAILAKILSLQAEKDSLLITREEIENELDRRIQYYITQYGSRKKLEDIAGKTVYQLKEDSRPFIREQLLRELMMQKISARITISPAEVRTYFENLPVDSLPRIESRYEIGEIIIYPKPSRAMEQYYWNELNEHRKRVEANKEPFCTSLGQVAACQEIEISRNESRIEPAISKMAFRLRQGQVAGPIKIKRGYCLIQLVAKSGDDATLNLICSYPPVSPGDERPAILQLDSLRSAILAGSISFNEAAVKNSESPLARFSPFLSGENRFTGVSISQLDPSLVTAIGQMKPGEISTPQTYSDPQFGLAVRLIYLKSRSQPHILNLHDDYPALAQMALEQKKKKVMERWLRDKIADYSILVDSETLEGCPSVRKYAGTAKR
jgi:peptidyl-prolyl cis-trans isomerase SurA